MDSLKVHFGKFSLISPNFLIFLMGLPCTTYYFVYVLFSGQVVKVKAVYVKWAAFYAQHVVLRYLICSHSICKFWQRNLKGISKLIVWIMIHPVTMHFSMQSVWKEKQWCFRRYTVFLKHSMWWCCCLWWAPHETCICQVYTCFTPKQQYILFCSFFFKKKVSNQKMTRFW